MPPHMLVALFFGAIPSCLAARKGRQATRSADTGPTFDCGDSYKALCPNPLDTSELLMSAMDQHPSIAETDALDGQLLSDFCDVALGRGALLQCTHELRDKCESKFNQGEAYSKTDIVEDIENLCWAKLPPWYGNPSWSKWGGNAAGNILAFTAGYASWGNSTSSEDMSDMLVAFDIEEKDGVISTNEACLMLEGERGSDNFQGPIDEVSQNLPDDVRGIARLTFLQTSLKCRLSGAATKEVAEEAKQEHKEEDEKERSADTGPTFDCGDSYKALCPNPLDTSELLMSAMDQNPSIAETDALDGQLLSDFCDVALGRGNLLQCRTWPARTSELLDKCKSKSNQGEAYSKTEIVEDIKNICWAKLSPLYGNPSWSKWGEEAASNIFAFTAGFASWGNSTAVEDMSDVLVAFDIEEKDGVLSPNEACLVLQGESDSLQGPIDEVSQNIPDDTRGFARLTVMLTSLKCRLSGAATKEVAEEAKQEHKEEEDEGVTQG